jgi:DNA-binding MarR family transcriptional regulator
MRRILRELRLSAGQTQMRAGISAAQLYVLQALADGEESSLSDIAVRTMTDRTSVAAVVERLVEARLVSRQTASDDRRRAAIAITRAGRSVLKRAPRPPTALLIGGLDALPDQQLALLAEGLTALAHAMGLSDQPAGMLFEDTRRPARQRAD